MNLRTLSSAVIVLMLAITPSAAPPIPTVNFQGVLLAAQRQQLLPGSGDIRWFVEQPVIERQYLIGTDHQCVGMALADLQRFCFGKGLRD